MSATFARLFGADPASLPAERVLAALPTFWSRYHDWGDAEVSVRPGEAEIILRSYPGLDGHLRPRRHPRRLRLQRRHPV